MNEIYEWIGAEFEFMVQEQFETQGEYWGAPWAVLSESHKTMFGRLGGYILETTLIRGRSSSEALSQSFAYEVSGNGLEMGMGASYAEFLHFGTSDMPARPILPDSLDDLTEEDKLVLAVVVAEVIEKKFG